MKERKNKSATCAVTHTMVKTAEKVAQEKSSQNTNVQVWIQIVK